MCRLGSLIEKEEMSKVIESMCDNIANMHLVNDEEVLLKLGLIQIKKDYEFIYRVLCLFGNDYKSFKDDDFSLTLKL